MAGKNSKAACKTVKILQTVTAPDHKKWHLIHDRSAGAGLVPFAVYAEIPRYKAEGRKDGLVYRKGFKTQQAAADWLKNEVVEKAIEF